MADKDPKDMTASELLREADSNPCSMCHLVMTGDESCATTGCASWAYRLADKIDAELAEARKGGFNDFKLADWYYSADANGWPKPRDDESLHEYVDRCFLPRPCYEDGEPVQMGDEIAIGGGSIDVNEAVMLLDGSGYRLLHSTDVSASAIEDRVKRPAPEVLGSDGLPLNEDDTVYGTGREQHRYTVQVPYSINDEVGERFCVQCYDNDEGNVVWCDPSMLTHTPPDTQERIDEDKHKIASAYWRCESEFCSNCPSKIDGMSPREYYDVCICDVAQGMDIARRQRELDKRKGGAE